MAERGFEDLMVWKKAARLSVEVYRAFSSCRDYGFKDQICRASVSVPSNIAEGYERNSNKEFLRFLNIAKASSGELRTQLYIAKELGYLEDSSFKKLLDASKEISAMLSGLIKSIRKK